MNLALTTSCIVVLASVLVEATALTFNRQQACATNSFVPTSMSNNGSVYRHNSTGIQIYATLQMPCAGQLTRWFFLSTQNQVNGAYFSVWRPDNPVAPSQFTLVGFTFVNNFAATGDGQTWNTIAASPIISVLAYDVIGMFYDSTVVNSSVPFADSIAMKNGDAAQVQLGLTYVTVTFAQSMPCLTSSSCYYNVSTANTTQTSRQPALVATLGTGGTVAPYYASTQSPVVVACSSHLRPNIDFRNNCTAQRWNFNQQAGACLQFIGCSAPTLSGNNFANPSTCVAACGGPMPMTQASTLSLGAVAPLNLPQNIISNIPKICLQPPMPSMDLAAEVCPNITVRYYFSASENGCVTFHSCEFPFGFNNFETHAACHGTCLLPFINKPNGFVQPSVNLPGNVPSGNNMFPSYSNLIPANFSAGTLPFFNNFWAHPPVAPSNMAIPSGNMAAPTFVNGNRGVWQPNAYLPGHVLPPTVAG